ncbi:hypothetical protein [Streptomyces sp. NPDC005548]|uniref:hypothetical protein n=1 Tax=Streptomyces sp. NPDC005548 TaxID=3364724 RepID=UPI0036979AEA
MNDSFDTSGIISAQEILAGGSIFTDAADVQAVPIVPSPVISARGDNGLLWAVHVDGRVELGENYQPDEAARSFWETVQRLAPSGMEQQYGKPLNARINAELAAGQNAERKVQRLDQMAQAWKDRLPETLNRDTVVDAIHHVTREGSSRETKGPAT